MPIRNTCFRRKQRIGFIEKAFEGVDEIEVMQFEGLTVDFCKKIRSSVHIARIEESGRF
jgi:phosphopantetheine adenylyltransferase